MVSAIELGTRDLSLRKHAHVTYGDFWERAAHSVDHMFSLYFDCLLFTYFPFGFLGIWVRNDRGGRSLS